MIDGGAPLRWCNGALLWQSPLGLVHHHRHSSVDDEPAVCLSIVEQGATCPLCSTLAEHLSKVTNSTNCLDSHALSICMCVYNYPLLNLETESTRGDKKLNDTND